MKWIRLISIIAISAAAGLALGFVLRGRHPGSGGERAEETGRVFTTNSNAKRRNPGEFLEAATPIDSLDHDLTFSTGVTRWLYWMEALEHARTNDMPRLAHLALTDGNALKMVALRWMELNPRHFFDTLVRGGTSDLQLADSLGYTLLDEWIKRDPTDLIAALEEAPPFGARGGWRNHIAGKVIETDAELGLTLFEKWRDDHYTPNMGGVEKWAAANPRHAAEFAFAHPGGNVSEAAAKTIGREWAKVDPAAALSFAMEKTGQLPSLLADSALKTWAERNLGEAAEWLAHAGGSTRSRLAAPFVEAWSAKDPAGALVWSEANLTGSSLARAAGGILKTVAETDVPGAARLVSVMQPSAARTQGAIVVTQKWIPRYDSADTTKQEMTSWLASLDSDSIRHVLESSVLDWAGGDARGIASFLAAHPVEHIASSAYEDVAKNLARTDPRAAIEWASTIPETARVNAGSEAFAVWRDAQPDAALAWWKQLPSTDLRRKAYLETALRHLALADRSTDQFASLGAVDLPLAQSIIKRWVAPGRQKAYLNAIGSAAP